MGNIFYNDNMKEGPPEEKGIDADIIDFRLWRIRRSRNHSPKKVDNTANAALHSLFKSLRQSSETSDVYDITEHQKKTPPVEDN